MSLKDLLPEGTYEEITKEAGLDDDNGQKSTIKCRCPHCKNVMVYDINNPFRPFCSERCKLLDLGEWANDEISIKGKAVNEDEDGDLLSDPNLPKINDNTNL